MSPHGRAGLALTRHPGIPAPNTYKRERPEEAKWIMVKREWGVRWTDGAVSPCEEERDARLVAKYRSDAKVVSRWVRTGPWNEADPDA